MFGLTGMPSVLAGLNNTAGSAIPGAISPFVTSAQPNPQGMMATLFANALRRKRQMATPSPIDPSYQMGGGGQDPGFVSPVPMMAQRIGGGGGSMGAGLPNPLGGGMNDIIAQYFNKGPGIGGNRGSAFSGLMHGMGGY